MGKPRASLCLCHRAPFLALSYNPNNLLHTQTALHAHIPPPLFTPSSFVHKCVGLTHTYTMADPVRRARGLVQPHSHRPPRHRLSHAVCCHRVGRRTAAPRRGWQCAGSAERRRARDLLLRREQAHCHVRRLAQKLLPSRRRRPVSGGPVQVHRRLQRHDVHVHRLSRPLPRIPVHPLPPPHVHQRPARVRARLLCPLPRPGRRLPLLRHVLQIPRRALLAKLPQGSQRQVRRSRLQVSAPMFALVHTACNAPSPPHMHALG